MLSVMAMANSPNVWSQNQLQASTATTAAAGLGRAARRNPRILSEQRQIEGETWRLSDRDCQRVMTKVVAGACNHLDLQLQELLRTCCS